MLTSSSTTRLNVPCLLLMCFYMHSVMAFGSNYNYKNKTLTFEEYLGSHLTTYDLIDSTRIINKRSLSSDTGKLQLAMFNRTYHLALVPTLSDSISSNLHVTMMDTNDSTSTQINTSSLLADFYSGHVEGDPTSEVSGYFVDNQFVCTIHTGDGEVLNIEPVSILTGNVSETRWLAYYESSMRDSPDSQPIGCGFDDAPSSPRSPPPPPPPPRHQKRRKRTTASSQQTANDPPGKNLVCSLQVVADHIYYQRIGLRQLGATVRGIVQMVHDINQIFHSTELINPFTGSALPRVGFELVSIIVLTSPNSTATHFNAKVKESTIFEAADVLKLFGSFQSNGINFSSFCLNHLLTYRRMERNVLGLAYFSTPCQRTFMSRSNYGVRIAQNSGLTSFSDVSGFPLLHRQAVLVAAHELGHNMGSHHDPEGKIACKPEATDGGFYLMHQKSVTGYAPNNDKFSNCSIEEISAVVRKHSGSCLRAPNPRLCGNHKLDTGEQCDAGPAGDACCTGDCNFQPGAKCSDTQSPCCLRCQVAPKGSVCQNNSPIRPCRQTALCDGAHLDCPAPAPAKDGAVCAAGVGRCFGGLCRSACHPAASAPCVCPLPADACWLCCPRIGGDAVGTCAPLAGPDGGPVPLPVEWPCKLADSRVGAGRCFGNGTCGPASYFSGRMLLRLFEAGRLPGGDSFAINNIVLIALIVSLLVFVPVSLLLHGRRQQDAQVDAPDDGDEITFNIVHSQV